MKCTCLIYKAVKWGVPQNQSYTCMYSFYLIIILYLLSDAQHKATARQFRGTQDIYVLANVGVSGIRTLSTNISSKQAIKGCYEFKLENWRNHPGQSEESRFEQKWRLYHPFAFQLYFAMWVHCTVLKCNY